MSEEKETGRQKSRRDSAHDASIRIPRTRMDKIKMPKSGGRF